MIRSNPALGTAYATRLMCWLPLEMSSPPGSSVDPPPQAVTVPAAQSATSPVAMARHDLALLFIALLTGMVDSPVGSHED